MTEIFHRIRQKKICAAVKRRKRPTSRFYSQAVSLHTCAKFVAKYLYIEWEIIYFPMVWFVFDNVETGLTSCLAQHWTRTGSGTGWEISHTTCVKFLSH